MKIPDLLSGLTQRLAKKMTKGREVIGMDVGATGIKFVKRDGVDRCAFFPGKIFLESPEEGLLSSCREFLRDHHWEGASVACNIEHPSIKIRRLDLPKMPDFDLREAVRWQLRDVAEGSIDSYVVRYSVLEEYLAGEVKRVSLVAYAIKRDAVSALLQFLKKLSLKALRVEPTAVSLLAVFDRVIGWKPGEAYGLIDLGESKSLFLVVGDEKLFFSRPMPGISLAEGGANPPVFFQALAIEIQRSMDAYSLMFHRERVDRIFLTGGGASLPGLVDYLTKNLGIPSEVFDPIPEGTSDGYRYAVAVGLSLAG